MEMILDNAIINMESKEQFARVLREINLSEPHEVLISGRGDYALAVMTGYQEITLMFQREEGEEMDETAQTDGSDWQATETIAGKLIGPEDARKAIEEYYESGSRLRAIDWERV